MTFNPLPSHEGRPEAIFRNMLSEIFQSTSLSRGKTQPRIGTQCTLILSIHFPLTREDNSVEGDRRTGILSIHFPLTREDSGPKPPSACRSLSIHFPLTREDGAQTFQKSYTWIFQSTSLSRGKTRNGDSMTLVYDGFQSTSLSRGKTAKSANFLF